jgi:hypothetical protein
VYENAIRTIEVNPEQPLHRETVHRLARRVLFGFILTFRLTPAPQQLEAESSALKKIKAGHLVRPLSYTLNTLENCSTPLPREYTNPGNRHVTSVGDKGQKNERAGLT